MKDKKGKAGRVFSLTEKGKKHLEVCEKFISELEKVEVKS